MAGNRIALADLDGDPMTDPRDRSQAQSFGEAVSAWRCGQFSGVGLIEADGSATLYAPAGCPADGMNGVDDDDGDTS